MDALPTIKALHGLIAKKTIKKALSAQAAALERLIQKMRSWMTKFDEIDAKEEINLYCDQLEIEVDDAYESALKHLEQEKR